MSFDWTSIIKPALGLGGQLFDSYNQGNTQNNIIDVLTQAELSNYNQSKAAHDAYIASKGASGVGGSGGGGGGGGGHSDGGKSAANKGAQKFLKKQNKKALKMLRPYRKVGKQLLPEMTDTYRSGMAGLNLMNAFLSAPQNLKKLTAQAPATGINIGELPEHMKGK